MTPPIDLLEVAYQELNRADLEFRRQYMSNYTGDSSVFHEAHWRLADAQRGLTAVHELIHDLRMFPQQIDI